VQTCFEEMIARCKIEREEKLEEISTMLNARGESAEIVRAKISPYLQDHASEVFGDSPSEEFLTLYRQSMVEKLNLKDEEQFLLTEPEFDSLAFKL